MTARRQPIQLSYEEIPDKADEAALVIPFAAVGRLPVSSDNVAIASTKILQGSRVQLPDGSTCIISGAILEGHRFSVKYLRVGDMLTSWGLPFGEATCEIQAGDYVSNDSIIQALQARAIDFKVPDHGNFVDRIKSFHLDSDFVPGTQVASADASTMRCFDGYVRGGQRGTGTRSFILILGLTSRASSFCRRLESHWKRHPLTSRARGLDGVVAVAHAEGGSSGHSHNMKLLAATMFGFAVHPNIAACLVVEPPSGEALRASLTYEHLKEHARTAGLTHRLDATPTHVLSLSGDFEGDSHIAGEVFEGWLMNPAIAEQQRQRVPVSELKIAQQCGGSDAFSGVSGNPLVGSVCRELIRHGGTALLAETDELIGAEPYILANARSRAVAESFLGFVERFKERLAAHGRSAAGNPSGGNKFRGLYNIALKSLGAARKKAPDVCLDGCIDYAAPLPVPSWGHANTVPSGVDESGSLVSADAGRSGGYYFMNSPGNDLESIAGQVATGCNLITFTTGNGAITNFPFVPTVKVITTTGRWNMLGGDMDFNAGRYQDGESMEALTEELFQYITAVCSGERSVGERAAHAQVSVWRDWPIDPQAATTTVAGVATTPDSGATSGALYAAALEAEAVAEALWDAAGADRTDGERIRQLSGDSIASGVSITALESEAVPPAPTTAATGRPIAVSFRPFTVSSGDHPSLNNAAPAGGVSTDAVGLVFPTSLCSAEIARLIARDLNEELSSGRPEHAHLQGVTRFVALPHTEGCGSGGSAHLYDTVLIGHLASPLVRCAVLLEHGCEMHHNDYVTQLMRRHALDRDDFGWASVQMDGGIAHATVCVKAHFQRMLSPMPASDSAMEACDRSPPAPALSHVHAPTRALVPRANMNGCVIGLLADEKVPLDMGSVLAGLALQFMQHGAAVVVPRTSALLRCATFMDEVYETRSGAGVVQPTLAFAQRVAVRKDYGAQDPLWIMDTPTQHWVETATGLAATGANLIVAYSRMSRQGHPIVPMLMLTDAAPSGRTSAICPSADGTTELGLTALLGNSESRRALCAALGLRIPFADADLVMPCRAAGDDDDMDRLEPWVQYAMSGAMACLNGEHVPSALRVGNVDFQLSRGRVGVSV